MKRIFLAPLLAGLLLLLGGCEFRSGDMLLQAPQPSKAYEALHKQLSAIAEDGMVAVSPQTGQNRTTVQLVDLNLDGEEEVIAFFCEATNPDQFHVYVFEKQDGDYALRGNVSGTGVHITSVSYPTLRATGERGIALSWKLGGDTAGNRITLCSFSGSKLITLLETSYQALVIDDLTASGTDDLVLLTTDASGRRIAQIYSYTSDDLVLRGETMLAPEVQTVVSLKTGWLAGQKLAVLAEGKPELGTGLMTDILIYDEKGFRNLAFEGEDASYQGTYRPVSVPSGDVNGDGLIEVPRAVAMPGTALADAVYRLDWYAYSPAENPVLVSSTYQNVSENWQFVLSDAWRDRVTVTKDVSESMNSTTFLEYREGESPIPLLTIYRLTGDMRSYYAAREGMLILAQTQTEIFTASVPSEAASSALTLHALDIEERFSVITQSWGS